jgi:starch-binding outer membrane protein, SusD/RagB family
MKRQNKLITLVAIAAVTATMGSCSKSFLEKSPQSSLTTGNFYKTAKDAEGALIGAYDALQQEYYIWDYQINGDTRSDNTYAGGDNPTNFQIDKFQVNAINSNIERDWNMLYNAVMRANAVLDNVPNITDPVWTTDERKNQILGEAKFLRALHYFHIVRNWGEVPLVLSMNDPEVFKTRSSVADVYAAIETDLKEAEAVLPETYSTPEQTRGRATKGAAQALLAKVYAQQLKYAECLEYCNKVLANTNYSLLANYNHLFDGAHENNSESIFEIQYHGDGEGDWGIQLITPESVTGDQWKKFNVPSHDLVQKMRAEGDSIRLHASIIFEFVTARPDEYPTNIGDPVPFIFKWKHPNGWNSPDNVMLIRLADIMLLKAEALNETSQTAQAIPIINAIRDRVDLPPTTATTQPQVREAILKERRFELAFEGERWYDLLRAGAQYTLTTMNALKGAGGANLNYNVTQEKLLFPIPQNERDLNRNLSQNQGY